MTPRLNTALGVCYAKGEGVAKDLAEGYKWSLLAADQGDKDAKELAIQLENNMSREQKAEGQKLARDFKLRKLPADAGSASSTAIVETRPESSGSGFFPPSPDSADEMMQKGEQRARASFEALEAERKYEESIGGFHVRFNQEFKLGDYTYKMTTVEAVQAIVPPDNVLRRPSEGACFIMFIFLIRNDGKQTTETDADDFRLRDAEGREFSPDSAVTTAASAKLSACGSFILFVSQGGSHSF